MVFNTGKLVAGRYRCVSSTHCGFFDRIHAVDTNSEDKDVFVLRLTDTNSANPKAVDRFRAHADALQRLKGREHVVAILESHIPRHYRPGLDTDIFFVTEYLPKTLECISAQETTTELKLRLLAKVLSGLGNMHDLGLLHLKLCPEVVGVSDDLSVVKLLDLGNCRQAGGTSVVSDTIARYTAPEVYQETQELAGYSDVYSVGHIFYQYLSDEATYESAFAEILSEDSAQVRDTKWINWHRGGAQLKPVNSINPLVGDAASSVLSSMVNRTHSERPDDALSALRRLTNVNDKTEVIGESVASETKTGKFPEGATDKNKLIYWLGIPLAVVSLTVAAFSLYFIFKPAPEPVQKTTLEQVNKLKQKVIERKRVAEEISTAATNNQLQDANTHLATGEAFLNQDKRDLAKSSFNSAGNQYNAVIDSSGKSQIENKTSLLVAAQGDAKTLGVSGVSELLNFTVGKPAKWNEYAPELERLDEALEKLNVAIKTNDRQSSIGSSDDEINNALELCKSFSNECQRSWYESEIQRQVVLEPFLLDKNEVTVGEFAVYALEGGVVVQAEERGLTAVRIEMSYKEQEGLFWYNAYPKPGGAKYARTDPALKSVDYPVVHVTRVDASRYCRSQGKKLPTEAEWEYATRGQSRALYPWIGEYSLAEKRRFRGSQSAENYFPVGSFAESHSGFYDLIGGVSEWTITDDEGVFPKENEDGSQSAVTLIAAVVKGGSRFDTNPANFRLAARRLASVEYSGNDIGFRCVEAVDTWP